MRGKDLIAATLFGGAGGSSGGGGAGGEKSPLDALIEKTITEVDSDAETVGMYAFYECRSLTKARFSKATTMNYMLTFGNCKALREVAFLRVTRFENTSNNTKNSFNGCSELRIVDCHALQYIGNHTFATAYNIIALILRSETLCQLSNVNGIHDGYRLRGEYNQYVNPEGLHDGYVYVPADLVDEYKAATNWSAVEGLQFRALEDYTVDGTITGELDESKI